MATIINSGIGITGQRGRAGASVFSRNNGGEYTRAYASPVVTPNAIGMGFRNGYANLTGLWQSLDDWMQEEWNQAAKSIRRVNSVGNSYSLSGFNYFLSQTLYIILGGGIPSLLPVKPGKIIYPAEIFNLTTTPFSISLSVSWADGTTVVPNNQLLLISASLGVSPGRTKLSNRINYIMNLPAGSNTLAIDATAAYTAEYGALPNGLKVFFAVNTLSPVYGIVSPRITAPGIVVP